MSTSTRVENQDNAPAQLDVLLVRLAGELYAIRSASVREIIRYRAYTPVPGAPATLPGILSRRGAILPLVEPHPLLGLDAVAVTRTTRLVIIVHDGIDMALLVDAVIDLATLPADGIAPAPAALDPARARLLRGIAQYAGEPAALLDLDELIAMLRA